MKNQSTNGSVLSASKLSLQLVLQSSILRIALVLKLVVEAAVHISLHLEHTSNNLFTILILTTTPLIPALFTTTPHTHTLPPSQQCPSSAPKVQSEKMSTFISQIPIFL
jgi:hypothetical protein